jgi:lysine-N-methylase
MSLPVRHLPVVQNWDCHVCGSCCQEYLVTITDEEWQRIEAQDWKDDPLINGRPLFRKSGPWWARRYHLNHREDGSCVFLSEQGRCRIHERFGYQTKPLPCRLFPFVLVPAGDHWRVGMRFACPSAAANKGRNITDHETALREFAAELARREGLETPTGNRELPPPRLQGRQRVAWPELLRLTRALSKLLHNPNDRMERRLRKCLALANLCREAKVHALQGKRLDEFLDLLLASLDEEVPANPATLPRPNWVGRMLFRQAVAVFTRKDHGPNRGIARQGRVALLGAAWRFARGQGPVPRLHKLVPETTFEQIESATSALSAEVEEILERYYTTKVEALQFCGAPNFHLPFWEGLEMLALTYPVIMWVMRSWKDLPRTEAVMRALTIVDDHFGYNRVLRSGRQRFSFRLLTRTGEMQKLIAWYSR